MEIKQYADKTNALVTFANDNNKWVDAFGDVSKFILENGTPVSTTATRFAVTAVNSSTFLNDVTAGGKMIATTDTAEYDGINAQVLVSNFEVDSTKPFQFYCKFKVSDATQSDILIGLASVDTALMNVAASHAVALTGDGLFFLKLDGSTTMSAEVYLDNAESGTADYGTAIDTSATELLIKYDGSKVQFYIDNNLVGSFTGSLPDSVLTPSINFRAGEAAAKTLTIYDFSMIQLN
jgi:hypothetical protein